ncbi:EP300-interacting inhibitor of differentiation 1-like [Muntiacus reevesi]|uniref:EP300-interacting inhibitor of differentiation 1 n=1 Tax=Muntiacus reevesi TaxID=9886 RepID=A0A5N3XFZ6_MUNRE|nr:hypothetical protein FD755_015966 [Muntiacus reevesi]
MSEMNKLSELYEESNDLQMDVMPGESVLPHMEAGGGSRKLSPNPSHAGAPLEEGPMQEEAAQPTGEPQGPRGLACRPSPGEQPGEIAVTDFESDDYQEEKPLSGAGYRVSAALEEANKVFLRTSTAIEAALNGGFQMHNEKTPFDQLVFIKELLSPTVVNRLTKELGCSEIID